MITRPLDLENHLSPPPRDLDFMAWVNVGVIVLFFILFGSQAVLLPGVLVGTGENGSIQLPSVGSAIGDAGTASVVVSYRRDNVILFEGGMYSLGDLRKQMEAYLKKHPGAVMLVRADRQVSFQAGLDLCDMARVVGFANVRLAVETPEPESPAKEEARDASGKN